MRTFIGIAIIMVVTASGRAGDQTSSLALIEALKDSHKDARREAAKALGAIKDARAVVPLVTALSDSDKNVRFYAAYALGEIKDARAAAALLGALRDPEWCVRDQAAWGLREIRDPQIVGSLAAMLKEPRTDPAQIAWIMRPLGAAQVIKPVAALLTDADMQTRRRAVFVLCELQDKAAVDSLVAALKDGDADVRRMAVEALVRLGDERAERPLEELAGRERDTSVRAVLEKAVARMTRQETLAAHWSFDDKSTTVAKDVSGRAIDGEIKGCTVAEGKVGAALRFGKGKFIEMGRAAKPSVAKRPFTIMAWVKPDAPNGVIVARGGAACGFSLYIKDGLPKFGIRRSQAAAADIVAGREKIGGDWTHLAGVVREDRLDLYVNGKLAGAAKSGGCLPGNGGQGMEIGFDVGNSAVEITDAFEGIIDEVKQFDAVLSEKEIAKQCR